MKRLIYVTVSIILCFLFMMQCEIFEPEKKTGSLLIILEKAPDTGLQKPGTTLASAQCTIKKGTSTVYNNTLYSQGGYFNAEIKDLDEGNDYSVLLYGKDGSSNIIARAYKSPVIIEAGKKNSVVMTWPIFR